MCQYECVASVVWTINCLSDVSSNPIKSHADTFKKSISFFAQYWFIPGNDTCDKTAESFPFTVNLKNTTKQNSLTQINHKISLLLTVFKPYFIWIQTMHTIINHIKQFVFVTKVMLYKYVLTVTCIREFILYKFTSSR